MNNSLDAARFSLPLKAVFIECLGANDKVLSVGSGFIYRHEKGFYLCTCWHVVTGYDPDDLKVKYPPDRMAIIMHWQGVRLKGHKRTHTGNQSMRIDLYDRSTVPPTPVWLQSESGVQHPDLSAINIRLPSLADLVMIRLPDDIKVSSSQYIDETEKFSEFLLPVGAKVLLVGYPYGYSTLGRKQPMAVVLTRFIAANMVEMAPTTALLDGIGAGGMSGCPVFIENDDEILLAGIYTGSIYPDHIIQQNNPVTALGKISVLGMFFPPKDINLS